MIRNSKIRDLNFSEESFVFPHVICCRKVFSEKKSFALELCLLCNDESMVLYNDCGLRQIPKPMNSSN